MPKKALLLLASIVAVLCLGEVLACLAFSPPPATISLPTDTEARARLASVDGSPTEIASDRSSGEIFVETPAGRRLRANAHVNIRHSLNGREIDLRTNSLGYRNRELGPKVELTRSRGHFSAGEVGVRDGEDTTGLPGRVPPEDHRPVWILMTLLMPLRKSVDRWFSGRYRRVRMCSTRSCSILRRKCLGVRGGLK